MVGIYVAKYFAIINQTVASILNSAQIQIMGVVASTLAYKLTEFENHRTETNHCDSIIHKLILFQVGWYRATSYIFIHNIYLPSFAIQLLLMK